MRSAPAIRIRPAHPADEVALRALDAAAWSPQSGFPSVQENSSRPDAVFFSTDNPPQAHLVAEADGDGRASGPGQVLGYIRLKPSTPLPENAHVLLVAGLAVAPAARGRGVATALLAAAEQHAMARGARKLSLRVLGTNAIAMSLYDKAGFVREGVLREEFLIGGSYVDDVLMAKRLLA